MEVEEEVVSRCEIGIVIGNGRIKWGEMERSEMREG